MDDEVVHDAAFRVYLILFRTYWTSYFLQEYRPVCVSWGENLILENWKIVFEGDLDDWGV